MGSRPGEGEGGPWIASIGKMATRKQAIEMVQIMYVELGMGKLRS